MIRRSLFGGAGMGCERVERSNSLRHVFILLVEWVIRIVSAHFLAWHSCRWRAPPIKYVRRSGCYETIFCYTSMTDLSRLSCLVVHDWWSTVWQRLVWILSPSLACLGHPVLSCPTSFSPASWIFQRYASFQEHLKKIIPPLQGRYTHIDFWISVGITFKCWCPA